MSKHNNHNFLNLIYKICLLILTFSLSGCGVLISDHFSQSTGPEPGTGFILRGSGWTDGKYGYVLPDVNQIETDELIIAVQINNSNLYMAFGCQGINFSLGSKIK
ncbi:MAG: hypothetical protein KKE17_12820 [Proteobacteria bacterium]|nr:hypothetical protein [Pseudomonadota bacterium]MBU1710878.1 hypothetical protein [Pseudomonadota bacterium]